MDAVARCKCADRRRQRSVLTLKADQLFLSGLTVEVEYEDPADPAGDDANAVAANAEPVVELGH